MTQRLVFEVDVEDDQEVPEIGTTFDVANDDITFLDAHLVHIEYEPELDDEGTEANEYEIGATYPTEGA